MTFTALGGMVPLINIQLGEIIFGGVGAGLYGMLLFVVITIFVAGLMVGRTPEYVGKKIEAKEVKMAMLAILILPLMILGWTAVAAVHPPARRPAGQCRAARLSAKCSMPSPRAPPIMAPPLRASRQHAFYNITGAIAMFIGRFIDDHPDDGDCRLARGEEDRCPPSLGTFPTTGGLFVGLLVGVILIVGGLTFFPALALGPIVEHLAMTAGTVF